MGSFGGFYSGEKKKKKKKYYEQKAKQEFDRQSFSLPQVEIIRKGKKAA